MSISSLYRIEAVESQLKENITVRDEERQRFGYEMQTCYRFAPAAGGLLMRKIVLKAGDLTIATLTYGPSAHVWKVNKGWIRRADPQTLGFLIDPMNGKWSHAETPEETGIIPIDSTKDPKQKTYRQRIIPYVQDMRNILLLEPNPALFELTETFMATLQSALRVGITRAFQIEDAEISVEPLPSRKNRKCLLIYEASEGGAGVLHSLVESTHRLEQIAREAVEAMHFDPDTFEDREEARQDEERCHHACYRCLLSYGNQPDQELIDRRCEPVRDLFRHMYAAEMVPVAAEVPSGGAAGATLVERWKEGLETRGLPWPDQFDKTLGGMTIPAFYKAASVCVYFGSVPGDASELHDFGCKTLAFPEDEAAWPALYSQLQYYLT